MNNKLVQRHDEISILRLGRLMGKSANFMCLLTINNILINKKWIDKSLTVLHAMTQLDVAFKLIKYQT